MQVSTTEVAPRKRQECNNRVCRVGGCLFPKTASDVFGELRFIITATIPPIGISFPTFLLAILHFLLCSPTKENWVVVETYVFASNNPAGNKIVDVFFYILSFLIRYSYILVRFNSSCTTATFVRVYFVRLKH